MQKHLLALATAIALIVGSVDSFAGNDVHVGFLLPVACKGAPAASHTRACALRCKASGFGLVLSDGTFLRFDRDGNQRAIAAIEASTRPDDLRATVAGRRDGNTFVVESIAIEE